MNFHVIIITAFASAAIFSTAPGSSAQSVDIALSQVGNPGNAADANGLGSVSYTFDIGTYDVTISQYCAFLNAVAETDPYGLYNGSMPRMGNFSVSSVVGITRSGVSGDYSYSVIGSSGNDPVCYVSWLDSARFCNWLGNGQPNSLGEVAGSTETGAYTLDGDTDASGDTGIETRTASATWALPTENEWYKAAYYSPTYGGPGTPGYWAYPSQSNSAPGNIIGSGANEANWETLSNGYCVTQTQTYSSTQNYLTPVGSFSNTKTYYGLYDMEGDVAEWQDARYGGEDRQDWGGGWDCTGSQDFASATGDGGGTPNYGYADVGFRVVDLAVIPEPGSAILLAAGMCTLAVMRRRELN